MKCKLPIFMHLRLGLRQYLSRVRHFVSFTDMEWKFTGAGDRRDAMDGFMISPAFPS